MLPTFSNFLLLPGKHYIWITLGIILKMHFNHDRCIPKEGGDWSTNVRSIMGCNQEHFYIVIIRLIGRWIVLDFLYLTQESVCYDAVCTFVYG